MLPQDDTLRFLSWVFVLVMALWIMIPYLRGKRDLISFLNIFLIGSLLFIGLSGVAWSQLEHRVSYSAEDYNLYYVGVITFYLALFVAYSFIKWPRRVAGRFFRTWPAPSFVTYFSLAVFCMVFSAVALARIPIPFVSQIIFVLAGNLGPFAITFALMALRRDSFNPLILILLSVTIAAELVLSLSFGSGRRMVFSLLAAFPVCFYWQWLRYKKPYVVLPVCLAIGVLLIGFNNGLQVVRHRTSNAQGLSRAVETLRLIASESFSISSTNLGETAQDSAEVTLFTIHHYASKDANYEGQTLFAPYYMLVNPIPRVWWEDKPVSLGYTLPNVVGKSEGLRGYGTMTWGVSPIAQGYHDGGLWAIALYGFVLGLLFRWLDEWLARQPDNPFLLGYLVAVSSHIAGLARGSMDTMAIQLMGVALTAVMLTLIGRMFFGSGYVYPRTDHILDYPRNDALARRPGVR
ncbi:O-antigen polymerase [Aeoliella sp. SH292]|uniref:O-antigen polymerase n=1 Tax=Aeoliella sp. SH292 TaxID=3454464 RepID=UPI003F996A7B